MISATESAPKGCARRAAAVSGFLAVARMYVPHRESRRTQQVPASCRTPLKRQSSAHKLKGDTVISHFYCPHYSNFDPKRASRHAKTEIAIREAGAGRDSMIGGYLPYNYVYSARMFLSGFTHYPHHLI